MRYDVFGMSCAACSARVESAVRSVDGVTDCAVNLLVGNMIVEGDVDPDVIISAVKRAGYSARIKDEKNKKTGENVNNNLQKADEKRIIARLISSVLLLIFLMYLSMGHVMWGWWLPSAVAENPLLISFAQLALSLSVMIINRRFFISGARAVLHLSPNMDTLVALGSLASFGYSVWVVFIMCINVMHGDAAAAMHGLHDLYFESAAMILTLITVGKLLEAMAKGRTTDAIESLMNLTPRTATVLRDGREVVIPVDELSVGDIFVVRPGESIPADGVLVEGGGSVLCAALTGESVPVDKSVGDELLAATVSVTGFFKCRAVKVGGDTVIAAVIKTVEEASSGKAPIAKVADKVAGVFVPIVMCVGVISFAVWLISGADFGYALARGVSVLVVSCPCALGLATPVAIMVGSGVGAKRGILFKTAAALEEAGRVRTVVLDKTGTVTTGNPTVTDVFAIGTTEGEFLSLALAVESPSEHPLARAIVAYAGGRVAFSSCDDFRAVLGSGVRASYRGKEIVAGSYKFITQTATPDAEIEALYRRLCSEGKTPVFFLASGTLVGVIALADEIRPDSTAAVAEMKRLGMRVVMLTGDNEQTALKIAAEAGIDEVIAEVLPDGKASVVRKLQKDGKVAMIGDGINDAPALTAADVGIAIGGGTDIAIESADAVVVRSSLTDATAALRLGRKCLKNIYENLFWAFIYNAIGIPLAAGVFVPALGWALSPMFGAAAMSLSSFAVVTNALRLYGFDHGKKNDEKLNTPPTECECGVENKAKGEDVKMKAFLMNIEGMMCPHCEARVKSVLEALPGVTSAAVSHKDGTATVNGEAITADTLRAAVEGAGYKVISVT